MKPANSGILTINGSSSSIKFALYQDGEPLQRGLYGKIDRIGLNGTGLTFDDPVKNRHDSRKLAASDHKSAAKFLMDWLEEQKSFESLQAVGHRVVHGMQHTAPELVTQELLDDLDGIIPCDPDHLPSEIELIEFFRQRHPKLPQVACFDTAFHHTMPRVAKLLPIPRRYDAKGVRRSGFHGLSYAYLIEELARMGDPAATSGRVILAHLGNGASMAAVRDGKSIDTSMSFTPASGLVMSTRSGDLDPRVTFVEPLNRYLMTYAAFSARGPRIALAISENLFHWDRIGLATFGAYRGIEFDDVDDKDSSLFPVAIPNPSGHAELAMLHRPLFPGTRPEETACCPESRSVDVDRESIWISYCPMALDGCQPYCFGKFTSHHRLASPVSSWERLKIGAGTPPVLTRHGWQIVYHGVSEMPTPGSGAHPLCYSAGVMVLSKEHPQIIRYRSTEPLLAPSLPQERDGTVANVVFPTGIDRRDDLGSPDRFDIYYGMADNRIGVARLDIPDRLPHGGVADSPKAKI
jgi:beta-1,2-mannobiose phosphorylase / 1,2-beta-oligomannan phosphorylase